MKETLFPLSVLIINVMCIHANCYLRITAPPEATAASCLQQHISCQITTRVSPSPRASVHVSVNNNILAPRHGPVRLLPSPMFLSKPGGRLRRYLGRSSCIVTGIDRDTCAMPSILPLFFRRCQSICKQQKPLMVALTICTQSSPCA